MTVLNMKSKFNFWNKCYNHKCAAIKMDFENYYILF